MRLFVAKKQKSKMRTYIIMCRHLGFFVLGVLFFLLIIFFVSKPFLPIFLVNGEVVHFPIICEFGHWVTRVRKMDCIANLSIGGMEWSDAKVSAEIALGGEVFAPVETLIENVST